MKKPKSTDSPTCPSCHKAGAHLRGSIYRCTGEELETKTGLCTCGHFLHRVHLANGKCQAPNCQCGR